MAETMAKIFDMDTKLIAEKIDQLKTGLDELLKLIANEQPRFPASKELMLEKELCLGCGEHRSAKGGRWLRGNHESCYRLVDREIKAGKLTEREAIEQGLLKPPDVGGRPQSKAAVRDYLEQREAERIDKIDLRSGPKSNTDGGKKSSRKPKSREE